MTYSDLISSPQPYNMDRAKHRLYQEIPPPSSRPYNFYAHRNVDHVSDTGRLWGYCQDTTFRVRDASPSPVVHYPFMCHFPNFPVGFVGIRHVYPDYSGLNL